MHTHVWEHKQGTPVPTYDLLARMCESAAEAGITEIAVTEHSYRFTRIRDEVLSHWNHDADPEMVAATTHVLEVEGGGDLDAYVEALVSAKDRGLPIMIGLEVDRIPGAIDAMGAVLDDYPFDFRLGSVHWLGSWLFDAYDNETFAKGWQDPNTEDAWVAYVDAVAELARSGTVDALAHLDLIKVAGFRPHNLNQIEDRLADEVIASGLAVEISSAGWRKPAAELYPSPRLLDRFVAEGVPLTTASDAHTTHTLGENYDRLRSELASRGVTELTAFDQRVPRTVTI